MSQTAVARPDHVIRRTPEHAASQRQRRRWLSKERVFAVLTPVAVVVVWEVASRVGWLDERIYSSPVGVVETSWELIGDGTLPSAVGTTLRRFFIGTSLGVIPGLMLGLTMGVSRITQAALNPIVKVVYSLPRVALFPLVLLTFGVNERSNYLMVALGPFFAMVIAAMAAVQNVDPIYLRVARSFNVNRFEMQTQVVLPAAAPGILAGLRIAIGLGLLGVVAVEFLVTQSGIGYLIWRSWQILSLGQSMAGLVAAGLLGFVLLQVVDAVERRLLPWAGDKP